jgi:hypothetical protein
MIATHIEDLRVQIVKTREAQRRLEDELFVLESMLDGQEEGSE